MRRRAGLFGVLWLTVRPIGAAGAADVFAERFETDAAPAHWTVTAGTEQPGMRWEGGAGTRVGWHFDSRERASASAPWDVGTNAFELAWDVEVDAGQAESWRYPGVYVALASAPPGAMADDDVAVLAALHQEGLAFAVKLGETYEPNRNPTGHPPPGSRMGDRDASPRGTLNAGGAGGHFTTQTWPQPNLAGTRLHLRLTRGADGTLRFRADHGDLPPEAGPWCVREWTLPPAVAAKPLRWVVVRTVQNPPRATRSYRASMRGRVHSLQGRLLTAAPPPAVNAASGASSGALLAGGGFVLRGSNFVAGARVRVGGREATGVRVRSDRELSAVLPAVEDGRAHACHVVNPDGLSGALAGGLAVGRFVERCEPREALPAGGDEIVVVGGGFDETTRVTVGGRAATVVALEGGRRLRVRVPSGPAGVAKVEARSGTAVYAGDPVFGYAPHPHLLFTPEGLTDLRRKFNEPAFAAYRALILSNADGMVPGGGRRTEKSGRGGISDLMWGYLYTGEARYRDGLFRGLEEELRSLDHTEFRLMAAAQVALAYDALFPELSPEWRHRIEQYLLRVVRLYGDRLRVNDWWYANNPSNTLPVGAGGGGTACLALWFSTVEGHATVAEATRLLKERFAGISPDGGYVEGSLYWNYAMTWYLFFAHALEGTTGSDEGLLDTPALRKMVRFVETQLGGDGRFFTFNDTQPWLTGASVCADLGSRFEQPLLLWLADTMHAQFAQGIGIASENTRGDTVPLAFLWRNRTPAPKAFPGVPTCTYLETMQWGVLRSEGDRFKPSIAVGLKGQGGAITHHAQPDVGSFVLQAGGEAFLIDPGYYQPEADKHSLLLLDGQGPEVVKGAGAPVPILDPWESGERRGMGIDVTGAYRGVEARRVRRWFVLDGARAAVILDDVSGPKHAVALFQCGVPAEALASGRGWRLRGKARDLQVVCVGLPATLTLGEPRAFERSWIFRDMAERGDVVWNTASAQVAPDPDHPLVSVLIPVEPSAAEASVELRHGADGVLSVWVDGREAARFSRDAEGWRALR